MDYRAQIDGVEILSTEDEVWFVQNDRVCWISKRQAWKSLSKLAPALREKGYQINVYHFPRKLREFILNPSKMGQPI